MRRSNLCGSKAKRCETHAFCVRVEVSGYMVIIDKMLARNSSGKVTKLKLGVKYNCINFSKTNLKESKMVNSKLQIECMHLMHGFLLKPTNNYGLWPCCSLNFQGQGAQHPPSTKSLGGSSSTEKRTVSSVKTKLIKTKFTYKLQKLFLRFNLFLQKL